MALWLMRHPRVLLPQPTCYGMSEVPVDVAHARQCAQRIIARWPQGVEIVCSGLARTQVVALQIAQLAAQCEYYPWKADARLNEMNFGCWEGVPWHCIPQTAVDDWVNDFPHHRFGGAECVQDIMNRIRACLHDCQQRAQANPSKGDVLWITHAGVIRAVHFLLNNPSGRIEKVSQWPSQTMDFGQMCKVEIA